MKLNEIKLFEQEYLADPEEIRKFLALYGVNEAFKKKYNLTIEIGKDGHVYVDGAYMSLRGYDQFSSISPPIIKKLPIRFGNMVCSLSLGNLGLETLGESLPKRIIGALGLNGNPLKNLDGLPRYIEKSLNLRGCGALKNLHGIHEKLDHLPELQVDANDFNSGIIDVLLIPHLQTLDVQKYYAGEHQIKAWNIVKKYVGRPDDIFDCQTELIDNNLEQFA